MVTEPGVTVVYFPITVVYSPGSRQVLEWCMVVPAGSTLWEALQASQLLAGVPQSDMLQLAFGIWGRKAHTSDAVQANDRIEVYRPLKVDPKSARRTRFAHQGSSKSAGLFARRRPEPDSSDNPDNPDT